LGWYAELLLSPKGCFDDNCVVVPLEALSAKNLLLASLWLARVVVVRKVLAAAVLVGAPTGTLV